MGLERHFPMFSRDEIIKPILGLIINLIFPGFGTIICAFLGQGGMHTETLIVGIVQLLLFYGSFVLGSVLAAFLIGFLFYIAAPIAWIWGIIWSIIMCYFTSQAPAPQQAHPVPTSSFQPQQQQYYAPPAGQAPDQYYQPPQPQYYMPPQQDQSPYQSAPYQTLPPEQEQPSLQEQPPQEQSPQ